jgi:hypothetical protein
VGSDLASGGDWLFRQGELVLGPLPATQIVEKLYERELSPQTEVARPGEGQFRRLAEVDLFRVHLAKAEAKWRVDAAARAEAGRAARARNVKLAMLGVVALVIAAGAASVARYLAVHTPWSTDTELGVGVTVSPPIITLAKKRTQGEDLLAYPTDDDRQKALPPSRESGGGRTRGALASRTPAPSAPAKKRTGTVAEEPDGLETGSFDQASINGIVAKHQKTLYPCLLAEAKKRPGVAAKIPIEFAIGNNGKVSKLWIDNPSYKDGPLAGCLLEKMQRWPFKPYEGEQAMVSLSFNIGGR